MPLHCDTSVRVYNAIIIAQEFYRCNKVLGQKSFLSNRKANFHLVILYKNKPKNFLESIKNILKTC